MATTTGIKVQAATIAAIKTTEKLTCPAQPKINQNAKPFKTSAIAIESIYKPAPFGTDLIN